MIALAYATPTMSSIELNCLMEGELSYSISSEYRDHILISLLETVIRWFCLKGKIAMIAVGCSDFFLIKIPVGSSQ